MNSGKLCLVLLAAGFIFGCGGPPTLVQNAPLETVEPSATPDPATYRIGPGDQLEVFVWRNPEISTTVEVRPDGMISTPLVEDMVAVGKTPSQLARDMEAVLATYIKSPAVNIIVSGFRGTPEDLIRVVGQAQNPQSIPYREGMTLLDVMIAVGGLGEFAAGNRAKLVRKTDTGQQEFRVKLGDLLNKGAIRENVAIQPGDVIIIPESFF
jgi:polysaccharide export outer membrane protein